MRIKYSDDDIRYALAYKSKRAQYAGMTGLEKFWYQVEKTDDCWLYLGDKDGTGRARFRMGDVLNTSACRVSYVIHFGDTQNKRVFQTCLNRTCVNPLHLELGD